MCTTPDTIINTVEWMGTRVAARGREHSYAGVRKIVDKSRIGTLKIDTCSTHDRVKKEA